MEDQQVSQETSPVDQADSYQLVFEDSMNISSAHKLKTELQKALSQAQSVVIDLQNLERIDVSAMQLLLGFVQAAHRSEISIKWEGDMGVFQRAVKLSGLEEYFEL